MLQKRSLIVIIFSSLYLTPRMIVKVFRRTVCPQIRVGSCFRSMTLVVNDAMVVIGKKISLYPEGTLVKKGRGCFSYLLWIYNRGFGISFVLLGQKTYMTIDI